MGLKTKATLILEVEEFEDGNDKVDIHLEMDPPVEEGEDHTAGDLAVTMIQAIFGDQDPDVIGGSTGEEGGEKAA